MRVVPVPFPALTRWAGLTRGFIVTFDQLPGPDSNEPSSITYVTLGRWLVLTSVSSGRALKDPESTYLAGQWCLRRLVKPEEAAH